MQPCSPDLGGEQVAVAGLCLQGGRGSRCFPRPSSWLWSPWAPLSAGFRLPSFHLWQQLDAEGSAGLFPAGAGHQGSTAALVLDAHVMLSPAASFYPAFFMVFHCVQILPSCLGQTSRVSSDFAQATCFEVAWWMPARGPLLTHSAAAVGLMCDTMPWI